MALGRDVHGELIEIPDADLAVEPPPIPAAITYKSDLFARCSNDAEAETILNGVAAMGVKLNAFFNAVVEIRHDHPLFADLQSGFELAFGEDRAKELLAPSN